MSLLAGSLMLAGCGMNMASASNDSGASRPAAESSAATSGPTTQAPAKEPVRMVEEFDDIPVPKELKRDNDLSFIYEAPGVTMGVVTYTGYYKGNSIAKFYRAEMPTYGWQFLNAFSDGSTYMVSFLKADRSCVISVDEGSLSTKLIIKVGPTAAGR